MRFGTLAQYFNNSGNVLAAGTLGFYASGSSESPANLIDIFSDINQTIPITNPVTLDGYGRQPDVFFTGSALAVLRSSAGVLIDQEDPVGQTSVDSQFTDWLDSFSYPLYAVVLYSGKYYESIQTPNLGNQPDTSPLYWQLFIDESLKDQTVVPNNHIAVGSSTTGLTGINSNPKGTLVVGNGTSTTTLAVGTDTYVLTADSSQAKGVKWAAQNASGCILLATVNPSAATTIDFLSTFSSTYSNYLVIGDGITVGTTDQLRLRLAVTGSADTGSNYVNPLLSASSSTTATSNSIGGNILAGGIGSNFIIQILNTNDAARTKSVVGFATAQESSGPATYNGFSVQGTYIAANAVTGFRLFLNGGNSFAATGTVKVFGLTN